MKHVNSTVEVLNVRKTFFGNISGLGNVNNVFSLWNDTPLKPEISNTNKQRTETLPVWHLDVIAKIV